MKNVNVWLLKRPGSAIVILSANTENHFNNCVRGGVPEWRGWFGERLHFILSYINYETLTTLSQLDVAKTGATHGPSEVIPLIEHTSSILFYYCWDSIWALLIMGVCIEVGGSSYYALPPVRLCKRWIHPGIPCVPCHMPYTSPIRFCFVLFYMECPLINLQFTEELRYCIYYGNI